MLKYYRKFEIKKMRRKGLDPDVLAKLEAYSNDVDALIEKIEDVFSSVSLDGGVGLWEADGIDDYEPEEALRKLRDKDEKFSWWSIADEDLNYCYASLSFFDAKGMRFHLPAYMILDLKDDFEQDLDFTLCGLSTYNIEFYEFLKPAERTCVIEFIELKLKYGFYEFSQKQLQKALDVFGEKRFL